MESPKAESQYGASDEKTAQPDAERPITEKDAAELSGGLMGGDDDLEDLEVERSRRR